jgi:predicted DNA-binding protein (MmcQ/YjbR family)
MSPASFDTFCNSLSHTHKVVQWGGAHVWKVAGKVFAIGWPEPGQLHVTFKCSPLAFEILKSQPGVRPAPYLASRGMSWIQRTTAQSMNDAALKDYIRESYRLVALGLPKKKQAELGLDTTPAKRRPKQDPNTFAPTSRGQR